MKSSPHSIVDQLYLWYLGNPTQAKLIGQLNLVLSGRGVSLRYSQEWLQTGFALSEDLPLMDIEHLPKMKDLAAGAVDDARPDRWGERVIRLVERPERLSILEMLFFAGDDRFGALGVSTSAEYYLPHQKNPLPKLADVNAVHALVQQVLAGKPIEQTQRRLIAPGGTMGGARPKALIEMDGSQWIVKFSEADRPEEPVIEHATMTLASQAGIHVAQTCLIPLSQGHAIAVKRFDRTPHQRLHALSANVALAAAKVSLSYPNLAQLLRRRGVLEGNRYQAQMQELFRRLVFNILMDNTDDHEKNHVLLVTDANQYTLSPAFDMLPTGLALGYQAMDVGKDGARSDIENALSMASAYGLSQSDALAEVRRVSTVVQNWQQHFASAGVAENTIHALASQIDRPFLMGQRTH
ncbi:type II toxin-antitoxin system HipA family toxin [Polynucleobacter brandtiae]|uniref:Serine/threonine-protein kinase HipA n=1 Tax=Polynucleobacter brandtiae TaxID=1938816 RepID=A0A2M8VHC5_9BURK|nr:HipA domain-containing protein [Polynucleobacter brandtiae]PJI76136.1 serine/threonine-protein kinase HipA [Polynucleobacter brandtiae]